jgi:hypothetical protein
MNKLPELVDRTTDIHLKHLIPIIMDQPGHQEWGWNDIIDYLINRLEGMRDNE